MPKPIPVVVCMKSRLARDGISQILRKEGHPIRASVADLDAVIGIKIPQKTIFTLIYSDYRRDSIDASQIRAVKQRFPKCYIVFLLEDCHHEERWKIERLGVAGVLLQSISSEAFVASLRLVTLGEHVFSVPISIDADEMSTVLADRSSTMNGQIIVVSEENDRLSPVYDESSPPSSSAFHQPKITRRSELSEREIEILACLVAGNSNKVIARLCNITEATVKAHLKAILRKTEVVNRTQAAVWALNNVNLSGCRPELRLSCE